jgi:hypothetical protein
MPVLSACSKEKKMEKLVSLSVVSLKTAMKYRRDWKKDGPTPRFLRKFMPRGSKGFRVYLPIGGSTNPVVPVVPLAVRHALRVAGYRVSDYLAKKCVKIKDKEQKNFYNIGKVIAKDSVAKAAFDNDPQLQNSNSEGFQVVVSCHPYDIIGMSTGRDWDQTSCMRLKDGREGVKNGAYHEHLENDVAEGTLVAYAIRIGDDNIKQPLCRCLLKPFKNDQGDILYRRESSVYGNNVPGFGDTLNKFVRKLNARVPSGEYWLTSGLYDDGVGENTEHFDSSTKNQSVNWKREGSPGHVLEANPALFPSWAAFRISEAKNEPDPNADDAPQERQRRQGPPGRGRMARPVVRRDKWGKAAKEIILYAQDSEPQFVKQAARVMALSPEIMSAFLKEMTVMTSGKNAAPFFRSAEFREAMKAAVAQAALDFQKFGHEAQGALTFASQSFAREYAADLEDLDSIGKAAVDFNNETLKLNKSDILKSPRLQESVWLVANLERERLPYQDSKFIRQIHRTLATIPKPETISIEVKRAILARLLEDGETVTVLVWGLQAAKNDPTFFAEIERNWEESMDMVVNMRKLRREMFKLADENPKVASQLSSAIGTQFMQDEVTGPEAQKEARLFVVKHGIDALTFGKYKKMISALKDLAPYIYCGKFEINNVEDIDELISFGLKALMRTWKALATSGLHVTAINPAQQRMFDFIGTMLNLQNPPVAAPFDFSSDKVLPILMKSSYLLQTGADFHLYPDSLNEDAIENITPSSFVRDDNGKTSLEIFAKKARSFERFCQWISDVMQSSGNTRAISEAIGLPTTRGRRSSFIEFASDNAGNQTVLLEKYQQAVDYLKKMMGFYLVFPCDLSPNFERHAIEWIQQYGYTAADFNEEYSTMQNLSSDITEQALNTKTALRRLRMAFEEDEKGMETSLDEMDAQFLPMFNQWHRKSNDVPDARNDEDEDADEDADDEEEPDEDDDEKGVYRASQWRPGRNDPDDEEDEDEDEEIDDDMF